MGLYVPHLDGATENIGVMNYSATVNPPITTTLSSASSALTLESTTVFLNNTSGSPLTLTSTPTIPDGYEEGHILTLYNDSANAVTLQGEASLTGSNLAETHTLAAGQAVSLMFADGSWVKTNPGNVTGPASATDNAIARFDLTTGKLIQNSSASVLDDGSIYTPALYNGTTTSNDLRIGPFNGAFVRTNTGRIKPSERTVWTDNRDILGVFTGIFREWYYYEYDVSNTFDVTNTGNLGEYAFVKNRATFKLNAQQVFSTIQLFDALPIIEPTTSGANFTDNQSEYRMFFARPTYAPNIATAHTVTGAAFGGYYSAPQVAIKSGSHASAAVVMPTLFGYKSGFGVGAQATVTTARHFWVQHAAPVGTITTLVGLDVEALSGAGTNIGVRIAKANTYSLQLSGTDGTAASGITFGTDTNLYRSAANTLKTDDQLVARIQPRVTTIASAAEPTINTDNCDAVSITALATAITSMTTNLTGTPNNFDELIFRIKDDGTARAITWGASFEAKGVALPTTTVISKVLTVAFIYDSVTSKWGCVGAVSEA
jgi:hypothetical protein